jgi:hypothetical protein
MEMCAGSTHTRGGGSFPCSNSNLPINNCWLLGAMVMVSLALTNQTLAVVSVLSWGWSAGTCLSSYPAFRLVG